MTTLAAVGRQTFSSLANPNYRRYTRGQAVSLAGTWMQSIAQSWLVLELTGSATALGTVIALQTLPTLLLGPYAGVVADRIDKRHLMIGLQAMMGVLALALGLLTITGLVTLWQVYVLALLLGLNNCFENPARQSFVLEMVGPADLRNAVSLNSVMVNVARVVGPAIAGIVISLGGIGLCFLLNAASFVAVVVSLVRLDTTKLQPTVATRRGPGQLREGFAYVRRTPALAVPLLMMALVGCLAYEFQVVLPVVAQQTFAGDARTYGFLTAAMGLGAVVGGLYVAAYGRTGMPALGRRVDAVRSGHAGHRGGAQPPDRAGRHGAGRGVQRGVPLDGQQHPAARREPADARARDGAVGGRVPRVDAHRRAHRGRRRRALRRTGRARAGRGGVPCRGRGRSGGARRRSASASRSAEVLG